MYPRIVDSHHEALGPDHDKIEKIFKYMKSTNLYNLI